MKPVVNYDQFKADRVYDIDVEDPTEQVIRLLGQVHMDVAVYKRDVIIIISGGDGFYEIGVSNTDEYYENFYNFYIALYKNKNNEPYEVRFANQPIPLKLPKDSESRLMIELIFHTLMESGNEFIKTHKIQIIKYREQLMLNCIDIFKENNYADFDYPFQYKNDAYCFKLRKNKGTFDISIEGVDNAKAFLLTAEWLWTKDGVFSKENYETEKSIFKYLAS